MISSSVHLETPVYLSPIDQRIALIRIIFLVRSLVFLSSPFRALSVWIGDILLSTWRRRALIVVLDMLDNFDWELVKCQIGETTGFLSKRGILNIESWNKRWKIYQFKAKSTTLEAIAINGINDRTKLKTLMMYKYLLIIYAIANEWFHHPYLWFLHLHHLLRSQNLN